MMRKCTLRIMDPRGRARTIPIASFPVVIGRDPALAANLEDPKVSRKHGRVETVEDGSFWLVDLDSTHGTTIAGRKIRRERIVSGTTFKMGDTVLSIEIVNEVIIADDTDAMDSLRPSSFALGSISPQSPTSTGQNRRRANVLLSRMISGDAPSTAASADLNDRIVSTLLAGITRSFPLERIVVLLFAEDRPVLTPRISYLKPGTVGGIIVSRTISQHVLMSGASVVADDPTSDPRFESAISIHNPRIGKVVAVPIRAGEKNIGVLYGNTSEESDFIFTEDDLECLVHLGRIIRETYGAV